MGKYISSIVVLSPVFNIFLNSILKMSRSQSKLDPGVLVEAKECYTEQLKIHLIPVILEGFISLYEDSVEKCKNEQNYYYVVQFQKFLKDIPTWNQSILDTETNRILETVPLMMELVAAIFVSTVKILSCVKLKGKNENIRIIIPTGPRFVHAVYTTAAEMIYYNPIIVVNHVELENTDKIRYIINKSIDHTLNKMIPLGSILKEYLENVFNPEPEPESEPERMLDNEDLDLETDSESDSEPEIKDSPNEDFINNYDSESRKDPLNNDGFGEGFANDGFEGFANNPIKDNQFGTSFNEELLPPMDVGPTVNFDETVTQNDPFKDAASDFVSDPSIPSVNGDADPIFNLSDSNVDPVSSFGEIEPISINTDPFADSNNTKDISFDDPVSNTIDDSFFKTVV